MWDKQKKIMEISVLKEYLTTLCQQSSRQRWTYNLSLLCFAAFLFLLYVYHPTKIREEPKNMSAFDKIIGYDMVKGELRQLADCLKNTEKYRKMGVSIPRGLLLEGEPGIAEALAKKHYLISDDFKRIKADCVA